MMEECLQIGRADRGEKAAAGNTSWSAGTATSAGNTIVASAVRPIDDAHATGAESGICTVGATDHANAVNATSAAGKYRSGLSGYTGYVPRRNGIYIGLKRGRHFIRH